MLSMAVPHTMYVDLCAILSFTLLYAYISTMYASLDYNIGNCGVDGQR